MNRNKSGWSIEVVERKYVKKCEKIIKCIICSVKNKDSNLALHKSLNFNKSEQYISIDHYQFHLRVKPAVLLHLDSGLFFR